MKFMAKQTTKMLPPIYFNNSLPPLKLQYIIHTNASNNNLSSPLVPQLNKEANEIFQYANETTLVNNESWINDARCTAFVCPENVKQSDVAPLFPNQKLDGDLIVFTIVHKTQNDMAEWNDKVIEEREKLVADVVNTGKHVNNAISKLGYWSDFIDPSSAKPYFSPYTNSSLEETSEFYSRFGLEILEMGCCKVISDPSKWNTHVFVSSIFTNMPIEKLNDLYAMTETISK